MMRLTQLVLFALLSAAAFAQAAPEKPATGYTVQQTLEFGGRMVSQNGNPSVFNTFVDLHSGPRLLEQSLEVRSRNHHGFFFDALTLRGSGYGGDPNSLTLLRMTKDHWY